jgi:hypothetical protein
MNHFTDKQGYNSISSQVDWRFVSAQPPGRHPRGAYFTTLTPDSPKLAKRLGISKEKTEFVFTFAGETGLRPLQGGRGEHIYYSPDDYVVGKERQVYAGLSAGGTK